MNRVCKNTGKLKVYFEQRNANLPVGEEHTFHSISKGKHHNLLNTHTNHSIHAVHVHVLHVLVVLHCKLHYILYMAILYCTLAMCKSRKERKATQTNHTHKATNIHVRVDIHVVELLCLSVLELV